MERMCPLASTEEVKASYYPGVLVIRATGTVPGSCWRVSISKSPLAVTPPEFAIERCRTTDICDAAIRPYSVERHFTHAILETIVVHDEDGPREIDVDVQPDMKAVTPQAAGEFIGYSDNLSYDEALQDAVNQVPMVPEPDQGYVRFTVSEVAGEVGGIAALQRLSVRIKMQD